MWRRQRWMRHRTSAHTSWPRAVTVIRYFPRLERRSFVRYSAPKHRHGRMRSGPCYAARRIRPEYSAVRSEERPEASSEIPLQYANTGRQAGNRLQGQCRLIDAEGPIVIVDVLRREFACALGVYASILATIIFPGERCHRKPITQVLARLDEGHMMLQISIRGGDEIRSGPRARHRRVSGGVIYGNEWSG